MLFSITIPRCFATCLLASSSETSCSGGSFTVPSYESGQQVLLFGVVEG